ncbi:MAG TPA: hypothetical protein DEU95_01495 [Chloroflexi bacterium]|nr:hypothetical protein [Chloroflexota bacterium]HCG28441.1 hypothetical protein [Chloroflexota bacterium]
MGSPGEAARRRMNELVMLWRGVTMRCPVCGSGKLFQRWTHMVGRCPRCDWSFEHEEGYWVGAMAFNIVLTELIFAVLLVAIVIATWPDIPVWRLILGGVILNIVLPFFLYPISKTIWAAVDLAFLNRLPPGRLRR